MKHIPLPALILFFAAPVWANDVDGTPRTVTVEARTLRQGRHSHGRTRSQRLPHRLLAPHPPPLEPEPDLPGGSGVGSPERRSAGEIRRLQSGDRTDGSGEATGGSPPQDRRKEAEIGSKRQELLLQKATAEKELKTARIYAEIPPDLVPREDSERYRYDVSQARIKLEKAGQQLSSQKETGLAELEVLQLDYQRADLQLKQLIQAMDRLTVRAPRPDWPSGRAISGRNAGSRRGTRSGAGTRS